MGKYTGVIRMGDGKGGEEYNVGWWDSAVGGGVNGFHGPSFDSREKAEAYRETLGYKEYTDENMQEDYRLMIAELELEG